ncbi:MIP/aquaporin family protein [Saccharopolyspora dendranthemae]|uniref:Glycerol uptake facilitator protein n=1 Tax=Saccharopolyspora dendranthemae TaxID=1181886 RepID=A0A561V838_9PSEU|nr:MIP/aquaporin family protein [Saccharopolyspora dendranthemae]TWG07781.1 glycerol uptake facilitator protein [Saccharopolyspora dendranthemae]
MAEQTQRRSGYGKGLTGELLAEFLGTFVLILLGCGSVAVAVAGLPGSGLQEDPFGAGNWLIIAFGWGFAVVFGVYVAGGVSGAHINPAVTLAFAVRRAFPWVKVVPYMFAQLVGAFLAAGLVYSVYSWAIDAFNAKAGVPRSESLDTFAIFATFPAEYFGGSWWGPLLDQIVGTGILVLLIFALIDARNSAPAANLGPFMIGMVVTVIGLTFGPNAGYAINPARDFGPRLWTFFTGWGDLALPGNHEWFSFYFWIPIVGPLIGAVIGAVVYDLFIGQVVAARTAPPEPGRAGDETA